MKITHTPPREASWSTIIYSDQRADAHLVEDHPVDESRSMYRLKGTLRDWLVEHEHRMTIDRGDFGEGAEHFHITFSSEEDADAFMTLCKNLK